MRTHLHFLTGVSAVAVLLFGMAAVHSAPPAKKAMADSQALGSNAIPQSVFTIPINPKEGRDPFYPYSVRLYGGSAPKRPIADTPVLVLNGLSGSADHKLAMINGRTMAEGEEAEVSNGVGRVRIRCVEIKPDSVIVEMGTERKELRLRGN